MRKGKKLILELSDEIGHFVAYSVIFRVFWIENPVLNHVMMYFVMEIAFWGVPVLY